MKLPIRMSSVAAVAALMLISCARPARVVAPERLPAPDANSPQGAVKAFEWAVNNRDLSILETLFTEDFEFVSAGTDSAGNPSREVIGGRDRLLAHFRCMFEGGGVEGVPAASSIRFTLDKNLIPQRDTRPGYRDADSLYRTVRTSLDLQVTRGDGQTFEITGYALFFLARGDSVAIPMELRSRGFTHDKTRWWITRWEDETISAEGKPTSATDPVKKMTIADVLGLFDCP